MSPGTSRGHLRLFVRNGHELKGIVSKGIGQTAFHFIGNIKAVARTMQDTDISLLKANTDFHGESAVGGEIGSHNGVEQFEIFFSFFRFAYL